MWMYAGEYENVCSISYYHNIIIQLLQDWPPTFDSYNKIKYFWFVFVFLNSIWIFVPIYFYYDVYRRLSKALTQAKYKLD